MAQCLQYNFSTTPYIDSHIHLYEYGEEAEKLCKEIHYIFLAVSDDIQSSLKTIEIAKKCSNVVPSIGFHPWNVKEPNIDFKQFENIIKTYNVKFLGEVGLDKKFVSETFNVQLHLFENLVAMAKDYELGLSVHAPNAWREALEVLRRSGVKIAIFHWYTGPAELLREIVNEGFYIGINVAAKIQKKHLEIIKIAPLESIVTESDGPYNYRGLVLGPAMLPELIALIAKIKNVDEKTVREAIWRNFYIILKNVGIC
ncbi:TatD family hydrolase [Ignisphaera sp. 4213-co]|uniref:TatD family hydrolase n=1 Tax=Ignisphaera cupida TaxID=3050454 RepID=A0ABD4Z3X1_9CREN|nr:TatD family hydrolase [Ignisphaera sp. 4213-co]MDK6028006.1 TatD family hydrolase [Ignisphaera sp. 4213-co]